VLREEYIEVDGDPAEFDDLVNAEDELTTIQTSLCRRIFQEAYGMNCDGIGLKDILPRIADLVEYIPGFEKYEKKETVRMILQMACVLPSQEITKRLNRKREGETRHPVICTTLEERGATTDSRRIVENSQSKAAFFEIPDYIE
jgi:hypothetical protein